MKINLCCGAFVSFFKFESSSNFMKMNHWYILQNIYFCVPHNILLWQDFYGLQVTN